MSRDLESLGLRGEGSGEFGFDEGLGFRGNIGITEKRKRKLLHYSRVYIGLYTVSAFTFRLGTFRFPGHVLVFLNHTYGFPTTSPLGELNARIIMVVMGLFAL